MALQSKAGGIKISSFMFGLLVTGISLYLAQSQVNSQTHAERRKFFYLGCDGG